jgi:hypothetical protein
MTDHSPSRGIVTAAGAALCAPAILGTAILATLALVQGGTLAESRVLGGIFDLTWGPAFLGAVYGPALIPLAGVLALRSGPKYRWVAWITIVLGLVATAVTYVWALDAVELP